MALNDTLIELRKEKGIKQRDLAKELGFSNNMVCEWEKGRSNPNIETLIKLADYFAVSIDYLVGRADELNNVNVITNGAALSKDEKTLLDCFDKLGPFERDAILIQIKALARKSESQTIKK